MSNKKVYPRFNHDRIDNHPIIGKIKIYDMGVYPISNSSGCQTNFFTNNAEIDNPTQYGIKMFNTSVEAFAAYQRQKIAAEAGIAPPVGEMVRWIIRKNYKGKTVNRWGYETCIANCSDHARHCAGILGSPVISKAYHEFCIHLGHRKFLGIKSVCDFYKSWETVHIDGLTDSVIFTDLVDVDPFSPFCNLKDKNSLKYQLFELDIVGTQYDDIADVEMGSPWNENSRLRLGQTWTDEDSVSMCSDLHIGNIGLWNGKAVCVDFGYHICSPSYNDDLMTLNDSVAA